MALILKNMVKVQCIIKMVKNMKDYGKIIKNTVMVLCVTRMMKDTSENGLMVNIGIILTDRRFDDNILDFDEIFDTVVRIVA